MAKPTVEIVGKKIILLSGYQRCPQTGSERVKLGSIVIQEMRKLQQSAMKNPDAAAFDTLLEEGCRRLNRPRSDLLVARSYVDPVSFGAQHSPVPSKSSS